MADFENVKEEITLHYDLHEAVMGGQGRSVLLDSADEGLRKACEIAASVSRDGKTLLAAFQVNKHIMVTYGGHTLVNDKPIILMGRSYFGAVEPVDNERHKGRVYPGCKNGVATDYGEWFPLAPGEKVYDWKTGVLLHTEPQCK